MYSPILLLHLQAPQYQGQLDQPDGVGESRYRVCGDHLVLHVRLLEGHIQELAFQAWACGPVVATASLACSQLIGLRAEEARALSLTQLDRDAGGLPPSKRHALWMFLESLSGALDQAQQSI